MVTVSQVSQVLLPWLGSRLLSRSRDMTDEIVRRLNRFLPGRTEPEPFCNELAVLLYGHVLRLTDRRLIVQPDGGFPVQMRTDDFNIIADDLLFLIFNTFPVDAAHLLLLQKKGRSRFFPKHRQKILCSFFYILDQQGTKFQIKSISTPFSEFVQRRFQHLIFHIPAKKL